MLAAHKSIKNLIRALRNRICSDAVRCSIQGQTDSLIGVRLVVLHLSPVQTPT